MSQLNSDLKEARSRIVDILGDTEPLEVLQRVEEHRLFWRPLRPRVILLAESHVFTESEELLRTLRPMPEFPAGMPRGFVRLVYALGYGENSLLDKPITSRKNSGTPQYWRAALYRPGRSALTSREKGAVLQTSWDAYTRDVVEEAEPEAVLCIGIGVVKALRTRLDTIGIAWAGVPQPQAHLSAEKHREISAIYAAVCADPTEIQHVPAVV